MATKMESVVQHALRCFTRHNKVLPDTLQADMAVLKDLVDQVTMRDVKYLKYFVQKSQHESSRKVKSNIDPMDYMRIYENEDVSIGVFILKQGAKLPIHDHPSMYGILKVLHGALKITNYTIVGTDPTISTQSSSSSTFYHQHALKVIKHPIAIIGDKDGSSTLTPTERSIHEVECVVGPVAFLDILAPPYEDESSSIAGGCHYFKELENATNDGYVRLMQVAEPTYWVESTEGN